jgi:hypothetical protein
MTSELPHRKIGIRFRMASSRAAEAAGFDLLLTTDKNMRYQQDLEGRKIAVVVLGQQQGPELRSHVQLVVDAVDAAIPGTYLEIEIPRE